MSADGAPWDGNGSRRVLAARGPCSSPPRRQDALEQWLRFAAAQAARCAPHPAPATLVGASGAASPLRLRITHLEGLPLFQSEDRNFEVRAGVTLFDAGPAAGGGAFFGATCFSPPVEYDMRKSKGKQGFHVDLASDFFFQTRAELGSGEGSGNEPQLLAVVEVVLVERSAEGVVEAEFSAGWAHLPLQLLPGAGQGYGSAPSSPVRSPSRSSGTPRAAASSSLLAAGFSAFGGMGVQLAAGGTFSVPVFAGSPRYLLLRRAFPEHAHPPQQLLADGAECRLHYTLELCPQMERWGPLLPDNYVVSYQDAVLGVQRLDAATGLPTTRFLGATSLLLEAQLCSVHALLLGGLQLQLPDGFLEVVRKVQQPGSPGPGGSVHGGYPGTPSRQALTLKELQQGLRLRVSVHNGRTFVGPTLCSRVGSLEPVEGHRGEHCLALDGDVGLAWVPGDVLVAVVLELVLAGPEAMDGSASSCGGAGGVVLAWGALCPFSRVSGDGFATVAEGMAQVAMRSGPGHWARSEPVLDWRRLIERTNRVSPSPPLACFQLREVPGRRIWPPPATPVSLSLPRGASLPRAQSLPRAPSLPRQQSEAVQVQLPSKQPSALFTAPQHPRGPSEPPLTNRSSLPEAPSEAETLHSVRGSREGAERKGKGQQPAAYKALARAQTVQAWQLSAHWDQPPAGMGLPGAWGGPTAGPAPIKTKPAGLDGQRSRAEEEALFTGSPSAHSPYGHTPGSAFGPPTHAAAAGDSTPGDWWAPGSRGRLAVRSTDVAALAATATPASYTPAVPVSLAAELADPLDTDEVTLQFVGFAPAPGASLEGLGCSRLSSRGSSSCSTADQALAQPPGGGPGCVHFTFRLFSNAPTMTAPARLQPLPAGGSGRWAGGLCALVPAEVQAGGSPAAAAGVGAMLPLADPEQLKQQLDQLAAEGLAGCDSSAARQLRLRAARYLAERWLQVDVWDSASLLQVGTFSVPLRGLLRQGQEVAEAVYECEVFDQAQIAQREGEPATLASTPLCGSLFVRLVNRGRSSGLAAMEPPGEALAAAPAGRRGQQGVAAVVVRAQPALDEAGEIAHDLAGAELGAAASPRTLREEIIQRAQTKVQRILHYRHISSASGDAGAAADVERLVHDQLLADVEQARDRCKPGVILRKLQQELPANVVLCTVPGGAAGFEREFINPSHEEGVFEVTTSAPAQLQLVTDSREWQGLAGAAEQAGLLLGSTSEAGPRHTVTAPRFRLGPRERALLRFASREGGQPQQAQQGPESLRLIEVSIARVQQGAARHSSSAGSGHAAQQLQQERAAPLASFRVAVLPQPVIYDRTLRLYHAASAGLPAAAAPASRAVFFSRLPASERLACGGLGLACGPCLSATVLQGPVLNQPAGLLLSFQPPPASASLCTRITAFSGQAALESWEVFVHSLPCVELSTVVGESVSAERRLAAAVAAAAGHEGALQLSCHTQCQGELQVSPSELELRRGEEGRITLTYTPQAPTLLEALVAVVDSRRRLPLEMLLVRLDSTATRISRTFEVRLERGKSCSKKVGYTNPYRHPTAFTLRTTQPGLLRFSQPELEAAGGATVQLRMTFDAAAWPSSGSSSQELLVFVDNVAQRRVEECFQVVLRLS